MSKLEVNTVDVQCGSTLTLGSSGKTVTLATGASQSGFGRTGTVDWCTTAKTSPLTAVSGNGYFINTTGGAVTVTLPSSPTAGDIVALKDYANTWDDACKAVTVGRNGSKINGICQNATLDTESQSVTLIYVDGTKGWQDIHDSTSDVTGQTFICASGGNATLTCGNYKTHIFTADGTFTVNSLNNTPANNTVEYLVVAGGAGGGDGSGTGGGGAGGYRTTYPSPISGGLPVSVQGYPIVVGAGGVYAPTPSVAGTSGGVSTFSTITSAGGGGGGSEGGGVVGATGGSGGGSHTGRTGAAGNTPPVSPPQGNAGGNGGGCYSGGGGGGASAVGFQGKPSAPGAGGDGAPIATAFFGPTAPSYGTPGPSSGRYFAGGGGGGNQPPASPSAAQTGGAGGGGTGAVAPSTAGTTGTVNTGGGGGGGISSPTQPNGSGGSGFVAIRYKFQ
jgi:hypothetical protein